MLWIKSDLNGIEIEYTDNETTHTIKIKSDLNGIEIQLKKDHHT